MCIPVHTQARKPLICSEAQAVHDCVYRHIRTRVGSGTWTHTARVWQDEEGQAGRRQRLHGHACGSTPRGSSFSRDMSNHRLEHACIRPTIPTPAAHNVGVTTLIPEPQHDLEFKQLSKAAAAGCGRRKTETPPWTPMAHRRRWAGNFRAETQY